MNELFLGIIAILLGGIGYFIKRILDKSDAIGIDVADMKPKVDVLWKEKFAPARSPRQLNDLGKSILEKSGIKEIVEEKKPILLEKVKELKPANAYDAERMILAVMEDLPKHCPEVIDRLKDGAFNVGQDINTVLLIGGLYLRDLIFSDLGFSLIELDKPKTV